MHDAPLSGVRVLDVSRVLAGPFCTALLADVGAEVIKVESPGRGDDARSLGPFRGDESVYFAQLNRQKKSITLNLRSSEGVDAFRKLSDASDVVVENFRPGVMARFGLDYETLAATNPELVFVSVSGFGQDGPLADRPAYDLTVQAMSGLMAITGFPDGPPTRIGESIGDLCAGLFAAWSTSSALYARERTGRGTHLDVSMFDCLLSLQVTALSQYQVTGRPPTRVGNRHPVSTPFDTYRARDDLVVIAVASDPLFARLAALLGQPELADDPRFRTDELRTTNEAALRELIERWTAARTVDEVVAAASDAGVPASPVWNIEQALESAQAQHRRLVTAIEHPSAGRVSVVQQPVRFGDERALAPTASPALGQHTEEVLRDLLGLNAEAVAALRERGAV